jgi:hypothetical protein
MAVEALDHLCTGRLIGPDYLPQFLRVQFRREGSRLDQVTKEDRELAALGVGGARVGWQWFRLGEVGILRDSLGG